MTKSEKGTMDIKNIAREIKTKLQNRFQTCKISVTLERYSGGQSLTIALMQAPFEVFDSNIERMQKSRFYEGQDKVKVFQGEHERGYAQLNHYTLDNDSFENGNNGVLLTREANIFFKAAKEESDYYNYDESDAQTDYFDVNFYLHLNIGKWDKPFIRRA